MAKVGDLNTADGCTRRSMEAFDCLQEAIYLVSPSDSVVLDCNLAACHELKRQRADLVGHSLYALREDEYDSAHWQALMDSVRQQPALTQNSWYLRENDQAYPTEEILKMVDWNGQESLLISVRDITPRAAASANMGNRESLLAFVLNEATDGMWEWDVKRDQVFYSMPLKRMLGYGPYEIEHNLFTWKDSIHPEDSARVMQELDAYLHGRHDRYDLEYRLGKRAGGYVWIHDRGHVSERDASGKAQRVVGMVRNIHSRKLMEEQLIRMATRDELTGLLNRRSGYVAFDQQLQLALREQQALSIALFDLDAFKMINDTYGHQVGDEVLRHVGERIKRDFRNTDIIGRIGGEEFLFVFPAAACEEVAVALRQFMDECKVLPAALAAYPDIKVAFSMGLVDAKDQESVTHTLARADNLMYQAKASGKDQVVH